MSLLFLLSTSRFDEYIYNDMKKAYKTTPIAMYDSTNAC